MEPFLAAWGEDTPAEEAVLNAIVQRKTWKDDYLHGKAVEGECPTLVALPQTLRVESEARRETIEIALVGTGASPSSSSSP